MSATILQANDYNTSVSASLGDIVSVLPKRTTHFFHEDTFDVVFKHGKLEIPVDQARALRDKLSEALEFDHEQFAREYIQPILDGME